MELDNAEIEASVAIYHNHGDGGREIYVTVCPSADCRKLSPDEMMELAYYELHRQGASLLAERIFATSQAMELLLSAREKFIGDLDDGVAPTMLLVPANATGPITGVQVHGIVGGDAPKVLSVEGQPCGRMVNFGGGSYIVGCNVQGDVDGAPAEQSQAMLLRAEKLLHAGGATLADIVRTWMWLGGILDWYNDFNRVRREIFAARGILRPDGSGNLPASTGIGIGPVDGQACTMDFCAMVGGAKPEFFLSSSKQGPASKYGSAFARAAAANTPGGRTIYVSGTASIDSSGATTNIGDARAQIRDTLEYFRAILSDAGGKLEDVVHAMTYCKTPEVEKIFRDEFGDLPIPHIIPIADVCRDNLLFEIEATAISN